MNDLCKIKQDLSGLVLEGLLTKIVKHNSRPFRSDGLTVFFEKKKALKPAEQKRKKQENINSLHYYYILMNEPATTLKKYLQQTEQIKMKR